MKLKNSLKVLGLMLIFMFALNVNVYAEEYTLTLDAIAQVSSRDPGTVELYDSNGSLIESGSQVSSGSTVTVKVIPQESRFALDTITSSEVESFTPDVEDTNIQTFTMPGQDTKITVKFKGVAFYGGIARNPAGATNTKYYYDGNSSSGSPYYQRGTTGRPFEAIYLEVTLNQDCTFNQWNITDEDAEFSDGYSIYNQGVWLIPKRDFAANIQTYFTPKINAYSNGVKTAFSNISLNDVINKTLQFKTDGGGNYSYKIYKDGKEVTRDFEENIEYTFVLNTGFKDAANYTFKEAYFEDNVLPSSQCYMDPDLGLQIYIKGSFKFDKPHTVFIDYVKPTNVDEINNINTNLKGLDGTYGYTIKDNEGETLAGTILYMTQVGIPNEQSSVSRFTKVAGNANSRGMHIGCSYIKFDDQATRDTYVGIQLRDKDITEYQCTSGNVYDYAVERGYAWQKGTGEDASKIFIYENFNNSKTVTVLNSRIEEGTKITDAISKINVDIKDEAYFNDITVTAYEINGALKKSITEGNFELNKEYLLSINVDLASNDILIDNLNHVIVNHDKQYSLYYDSSALTNNTSGFTVSKTNLFIYFRFTPIERTKSSGSKKYSAKEVNIGVDASSKDAEKKQEAVISGSGRKGSTVTILLPENRRVLEVLVTDKKGNNIELNKEDDKTYSFIQPASNVNVDIKYINKEITLNIDKTEADIDGEKKILDVKPQIKNDRTMVPLRFIMETLGLGVEWLPEDPDIVRYKNADGTTTIINVKTGEIFLEGKEIELDAKPYVDNDRTMVPIRFISESAGAVVNWDEKKPNEVKIYEVE